MTNNSCFVNLKFIAKNINVHNLYIIGDEINEKHKAKWNFYTSSLNSFSNEGVDVSELEIEANSSLIYVENDTSFDVIDENGDMSYDWFKFMVKYIPSILDKNAIYTLLVNDVVYGTSKDWYNLFIHTSKKIDNKIEACLQNNYEQIVITLLVNGSSKHIDLLNEHPSHSRKERLSIFSDRIPERRRSDSHFGRNYLGKSLEKHYKKRLTEPSIYPDSDETDSTDADSESDNSVEGIESKCKVMCDWKIYNKKDYRNWLIKNHPDHQGDVQVFQMYRPILDECTKSNKYCED